MKPAKKPTLCHLIDYVWFHLTPFPYLDINKDLLYRSDTEHCEAVTKVGRKVPKLKKHRPGTRPDQPLGERNRIKVIKGRTMARSFFEMQNKYAQYTRCSGMPREGHKIRCMELWHIRTKIGTECRYVHTPCFHMTWLWKKRFLWVFIGLPKCIFRYIRAPIHFTLIWYFIFLSEKALSYPSVRASYIDALEWQYFCEHTHLAVV